MPELPGRSEDVAPELLAAYPKQVHLYYAEFPLPMHPWAKPAAIAGRCVFRQNAEAFWDYHDWIFEHQQEITPENLKDKVLEFAKSKQIDTLQLSRCIDTHATEADIDKIRCHGSLLGVNQTPTLFVNGRQLARSLDWAELENHHRLRNRVSEDGQERRGRLRLRDETPLAGR